MIAAAILTLFQPTAIASASVYRTGETSITCYVSDLVRRRSWNISGKPVKNFADPGEFSPGEVRPHYCLVVHAVVHRYAPNGSFILLPSNPTDEDIERSRVGGMGWSNQSTRTGEVDATGYLRLPLSRSANSSILFGYSLKPWKRVSVQDTHSGHVQGMRLPFSIEDKTDSSMGRWIFPSVTLTFPRSLRDQSVRVYIRDTSGKQYEDETTYGQLGIERFYIFDRQRPMPPSEIQKIIVEARTLNYVRFNIHLPRDIR
jgi:hypothetical protein